MNKFKKYFIPHRGNDFRPHFFRTKAVLLTASLIGVLFLFATALGTIVVKNSSQMFGAVISSVLVDLANTDRSASKLQGLTVNPVLVAAAQLKADDMAAKGYFAHTSPEGKTPWYWFKQAGYSYSFAGENLAVYFSDSAELEKAWMDSPTHRANILNSSYTEIGIAMAHGKYQGVDTVYVVQEFGRPRKSVALPSIAKTEIASPVKIALAETLPKKAEPKETPIVKGAEAETLPKILKEESTFIEVENIEDTATATLAVAKTVTEKPKTTEVLKIVASPKTFLKTVYSWIALFVAFALVIMIGVEIKRQHPRHIAYGVSLLILMGLLLYFWQSVFGSLLVV